MRHLVLTVRLIVVVTLAFSFASLARAASDCCVVRIEADRSLEAGQHLVVFRIYANREGGSPLATETHAVLIDASGRFRATLANAPSAIGPVPEERWVSITVSPRLESRRMRMPALATRHIALDFVPVAAISGNGIVESFTGGFRFPDGSVQTTAATVTGGVPSVNGISSAVTIAGAGTASIGTAGGTITVNGSGITGVIAGNGLTGGGSSGSPTLDVSFGSPVSIGSSNSPGVANTLARSDHVHARYVRTVVVSPTVGNPTASGTALSAALSGITGNGSSDPYLLKIEPGIYDLGTGGLTMKSYVDIEGSGENATFINTAKAGTALNSATSCAIAAGANSELRGLTITNSSTADGFVVGYFLSNKLGATIRNVTFNVSGGTSQSIGVVSSNGSPNSLAIYNTTINATGSTGTATGIHLVNATITVANSSLTASGGPSNYGLFANSSTAVATIRDSTLVATGATGDRTALQNGSGTFTAYDSAFRADGGGAGTLTGVKTSASVSAVSQLEHCSITATTALDRGAASTLRVATSMVAGVVTGTPTCFSNYNAAFAAVTCP